MSSTYQDEGPIPWFRTEQCIFYIVFFVVFPFFFVNIFVALIIVTFNELGEAELEDDIDKNQKSCINFAIQARPLQLYVPDDTSGPRYDVFGKWGSDLIWFSGITPGDWLPRLPSRILSCFWSSWTHSHWCSSTMMPPCSMWIFLVISIFSSQHSLRSRQF